VPGSGPRFLTRRNIVEEMGTHSVPIAPYTVAMQNCRMTFWPWQGTLKP
jgi:hypothetical protein